MLVEQSLIAPKQLLGVGSELLFRLGEVVAGFSGHGFVGKLFVNHGASPSYGLVL